MPLHVFQTLFQPCVLGKDESKGWYYITLQGAHVPFVMGLPSSIKRWKESWFRIRRKWQAVEGDKALACTVSTQSYEARKCPNPSCCLSLLSFPKFWLTVIPCIVKSSTKFELHEIDFDVIEDIYKRPLKLHHFDHLIDRSKYFINFGLIASKGKKCLHLVKF